MATRTLPGLGLTGGFTEGEDGWGDAMNANLLRTSVLGSGSVMGRVAVLPASPTQGDIYVLTTDDSINVYDNAAWITFAPIEGWLFYDRDKDVYLKFDGADWVVFTSGIGDAPKDGKLYARKDNTWSEVGGGGGIGEAPSDGKLYGRQDAGWSEVVASGGGGGIDFAAPAIYQRKSSRGNGAASITFDVQPTPGRMIVLISSGYSSIKTFPAGFITLPSQMNANNSIQAAFKVVTAADGKTYGTSGSDIQNLTAYEMEAFASVDYVGGNNGNNGNWGGGVLPTLGSQTLALFAVETDNDATGTYNGNLPAQNTVQLNSSVSAGNHAGFHGEVLFSTAGTISGTISSPLNAVWGVYRFVAKKAAAGGGGGGGTAPIATAPTIVQRSIGIAQFAGQNIVMPKAVTPGNLLIVMGQHYSNGAVPAQGWNAIKNTNGSTYDGTIILSKIATSTDGAAFSAFSGAAGHSLVCYEIADADAGQTILPVTIQESVGASKKITMVGYSDTSLVIGYSATYNTTDAPTSIVGATARAGATGNWQGGNRVVTPFDAPITNGQSLDITVNYASASTVQWVYGIALLGTTTSGGGGGGGGTTGSKSLWQSKLIGVIGDSLTADAHQGVKWADVMKSALGLGGLKADGVGGTQMNSAAGRVTAMNIAGLDGLLIFLGTNDFSFNITLGTPGDTAASDTFAGRIRGAIEAAYAAKPTIRMGFMTPIPRQNVDATPGLEAYANMVKAVCAKYGIPVLDLYHAGGFNAFSAALFDDTTHPNGTGLTMIGNKAAAFVNGNL